MKTSISVRSFPRRSKFEKKEEERLGGLRLNVKQDVHSNACRETARHMPPGHSKMTVDQRSVKQCFDFELATRKSLSRFRCTHKKNPDVISYFNWRLIDLFFFRFLIKIAWIAVQNSPPPWRHPFPIARSLQKQRHWCNCRPGIYLDNHSARAALAA